MGADDRRRRDGLGILFCQQLAVNVAHLHRTDGRRLSVGEARLLNWSVLISRRRLRIGGDGVGSAEPFPMAGPVRPLP